MTIRFLGYTDGTPYTRFETGFVEYVMNGTVSTHQRMRVAQFSISNAYDFPVDCTLYVPYTNGLSLFLPTELRLASHAVTNFSGIAQPFRAKGAPLNYPASADWTKPWRLEVDAWEASQLGGIRAQREQLADWMWKHEYRYAGRFVQPRQFQRVQLVIPPDSTSAQ